MKVIASIPLWFHVCSNLWIYLQKKVSSPLIGLVEVIISNMGQAKLKSVWLSFEQTSLEFEWWPTVPWLWPLNCKEINGTLRAIYNKCHIRSQPDCRQVLALRTVAINEKFSEAPTQSNKLQVNVTHRNL